MFIWDFIADTVLGQIIVSGGGESNSSQSSVILRNVVAEELVVDSMVAEEDFAKVTDTNWSNVALNYIG